MYRLSDLSVNYQFFTNRLLMVFHAYIIPYRKHSFDKYDLESWSNNITEKHQASKWILLRTTDESVRVVSDHNAALIYMYIASLVGDIEYWRLLVLCEPVLCQQSSISRIPVINVQSTNVRISYSLSLFFLHTKNPVTSITI